MLIPQSSIIWYWPNGELPYCREGDHGLGVTLAMLHRLSDMRALWSNEHIWAICLRRWHTLPS